jgi:hypothetical protein
MGEKVFANSVLDSKCFGLQPKFDRESERRLVTVVHPE